MRSADEPTAYQYVVIRCVPRVDREEFVNVGVIVYSQRADFLAAAVHVDAARLRALSATADVDAVCEALATIKAICAGDPAGGAPARAGLSARFGFLSAPRSTVVQPGPIHGGLTNDPEAELAHLLARLVD